MSTPEVVVHDTADHLAAATGERLHAKLVELQTAGRQPRIALTGGGSGVALLAALNSLPERDTVDWPNVHIFWGDERFVVRDDPERNEKQAREALLDHIALDPAKVHPMAASDGEFGPDVDAAAAAYAAVLGESPTFDVVMLGLGPEGHVASIFPETPAVYDEGFVVAVRNCVKPPPTRISLTLPAIRRAAEVWIITAGEGKAEAVARALGGTPEVQLPAAGAIGRERTLYLLDHGSAGAVPSSVPRTTAG